MWYKDKSFWRAAVSRAIRSVAQGILVGIGECVALQDVNWILALGTGGMMGVVSMLTSIAFGMPEYKEGFDEDN